MNRRAAVGFLVLAALVGATQTLDEARLAAIGERIIDFPAAVKANTTYTPLPRLQTANARLAFFEEMDYYTPDSTPSGWDDPYGAIYESSGSSYPAYVPNYDYGELDYYSGSFDYSTPAAPPAEPVEIYNYYYDGGYAAPQDFQPADSWTIPSYNPADPDNIGIDVAAPRGDYPTWVAQDPDDWGVIYQPDGKDYPRVDLSSGGESGSAGSAGNPRTAPEILGSVKNNADKTALNTMTRETRIITNNQTLIQGYPIYEGGGLVTNYYYQPSWYETAFPGWGTAVIPLLPSQYRPDYGCSGVGSTIAGALAVSNGGFGISLGYRESAPCYGYGYGAGYFGPYETVAPVAHAQPSCSISLSDTSIAYGGSTELSWASYGATSASINGIGGVPLAGSRTLSNQTASRNYGMTVSGPGGTSACYTALTVGPNVPPTCQISANPSTIERGQTANLAWIAEGATEASLSGVGTVALSGGRHVSPFVDTTYTLTIKNAGNRTATCTVRIDVR